jgi:WD40 repeat protein
MALSKELRNAIFDALLDAFPRRSDLAEMLLLGLDWRLDDISGGGGLRNDVLQLVGWAEARGETGDLVQAALDARPRNDKLRAVGAQLGLSPNLSPDAAFHTQTETDAAPVLPGKSIGLVLLHTFTEHFDKVDMTFGADGQTLTTLIRAEEHGDKIKVWDVHTGKPLREHMFQEYGYPYGATFSPDGRFLVGNPSIDADVHLWDLHTLRDVLLRAPGSSRPVDRLYDKYAFSPDGQFLAIGVSAQLDDDFEEDGGAEDLTKSGVVELWNMHTRRMLHVLTGHSSAVHYMAFSPDGQMLTTSSLKELEGGDDFQFKLWNVRTGKLLKSKRLRSRAHTWDFSRNGQIFCSVIGGPGDLSIPLWDLYTGKLLRTFVPSGYADQYSLRCSLSPDGHSISIFGRSRRIELWDVRSGTLLHTLPGHSDEWNRAGFSPNGQLLFISGDEVITLWDTSNWEKIASIDGLGITFSPDGQLIATYTSVGNVNVWAISEADLLED